MDKKIVDAKRIQRPRAGENIREGKVVPINARIIKDNNNEECYISAVEQSENGKFKAKVKYLKDGRFLTLDYDKIKNYI